MCLGGPLVEVTFLEVALPVPLRRNPVHEGWVAWRGWLRKTQLPSLPCLRRRPRVRRLGCSSRSTWLLRGLGISYLQRLPGRS